jgi:hypothetical protein
MKAFFFGAGASAGTLAEVPECPPVARSFGAAVELRIPDWQQRYPVLAAVVRHLGAPLESLDLERVWTCIEYHAKLGGLLPSDPQWGPEATRDLKRVLLRLYGVECDSLVARLPASDDYTLGKLLRSELQAGDVIVSFNWDTLVERLALAFHQPLASPTAAETHGSIPLAKPHGSVTWRINWITKKVEWLSPAGALTIDAMDAARVGIMQEPLVLGVVPAKSELIRETQWASFPGIWEVVTAQWKLVTQAVRRATALIVVGYGFPTNDEYGRFLLREAIKLRSGDLPSVQLYELAERAEQTAAALRDALGCPELQVEWKGPVTPAPLVSSP